MLKGTKYENLKLFGSIIVHLTSDGKFQEFRIPSKFINTVLTMDPLPRIDEVMADKKRYIKDEEVRLIRLEAARQKKKKI